MNMNTEIKTLQKRREAWPQGLQVGTSDNGTKDAALRNCAAVEGASALSGAIGVIRRLRRGRWTLTEVYG